MFWHEVSRKVRAHRASWELYRGPIPDGLHVLHRCDVRLCVNPDHLFTGTNEENIQDRQHKHRQAMGEKNAASKLREPEAIEIRRLYAIGIRGKALASIYPMSAKQLYDIAHGKYWREAS